MEQEAPWTTVLSRSKNAAAVGSSWISGTWWLPLALRSSGADAEGPAARQRIVVVDWNCRRVAARQGLNMADVRGGHALRSAHRALRSDHVITIMSSSAVRRARLGWVNDQDTAVQLLSTGRLDTNLADLVTRQAEAQPGAVALVQPMPVRRTMTWAELDRRIDAVAAGLSAHGLVAGHRIAIFGPNSIEFVVAYFATLRAGYVAVPINPQSTANELRAMINDCWRTGAVHSCSPTARGCASDRPHSFEGLMSCPRQQPNR